MSINIIQGDSSEIYTFESSDVGVFDTTWSASYVVVSDLGGSPEFLKGSIPKNITSGSTPANTQFVFQLLPAETEILAPGKYKLVVEIRQHNGESPEVLIFRREIMQETLVIKPQGYS